jgi:predicted thioesterase
METIQWTQIVTQKPNCTTTLVRQKKLRPAFTLGVRANVQHESSIPIGAKVEISPKGFTLGVKAEIEKKNSICPSY